MLKSYFITAWRNLLKNKFFSLLNIGGLTVGLSVGILILLWVRDEESFDTFHAKANSIYRLENRVGTGNSKQIWTTTVAPIGPMAKKELPMVQDAVRMTDAYTYSLFTYKDKEFDEQRMSYTDPSLFTVFDFPLVKGNAANPFPDLHSIVLTESTVRRYFGGEDPIGKTIMADRKTPFVVTGVIRDFPVNSAVKEDMLLPMALLEQEMYAGRKTGPGNMMSDFSQFNYITFLLLRPDAPVKGLAARLDAIHLRNKPDDTDLQYLLQPLPQMHLYRADGSDAGISTVRMFSLISVLILVIACINNVNLSTARSMLRSKEVSLRKIVGAGKMHLFLQFIVETALLFCLAAFLSLGLMKLLMPLFNDISGKDLVLDLTDHHVWLVIGLTVLATLIVSSIYPALLLSSFKPLEAMKGKITAGVGNARFRRVLVVVQFVFSVVLIVGTLVIGRQLDYIRSRQLGYDKDHVFSFFMRRGMGDHYDAVREALLRQPGVLGVARGNSNIIRLGPQTGDNDWDGKAAGQTMMVHPVAIDKDFFPFFKMQLVQGDNFRGDATDSVHFILNETAARELGSKDPVGKRFRMWNTNGTIIGVAKDFHFASLREKIGPAVFYYKPADSRLLYLRTTGRDAGQAVAAAKAEWKKYNAGYPFKYTFLDDEFRSLYQSEERTAMLFRIFSAIAILISCLGLFGLSAYTAQVRTREIGVRKVLGANVPDIVRLLGVGFIRLVLMGILIAVPLSWFAMYRWLQDFAYKIELSWTLFALAGLIAVGVALATISFQSIRAALANPVKSLRTQ